MMMVMVMVMVIELPFLSLPVMMGLD